MKKLSAVIAVVLISLLHIEASAACTGFDGFCQENTHSGISITRGVSTGNVNLAKTAFVPTVNFLNYPNPKISWGDGTESTASTHATPGEGCTQCILSGVHTYASAGDFTIRVSYSAFPAGDYEITIPVSVVNPTFIIGSVGDSVFSGEGNPDINQQWLELVNSLPIPTEDAVWGETSDDEECHRSSNAPVNEVRRILAEQNPTVNYSVENLACSGGSIEAAGDQVENLVNDVDLLIMSVGANNIGNGFSSIFGACIIEGGDCAAHENWGDIVASVDALVPGYDDKQGFVHLAERIEQRAIPGLDSEDIFITEYYDPTRGANGDFGTGSCMLSGQLDFLLHGLIPTVNAFLPPEDQWPLPSKWEWDDNTWELLYDDIVVPLNNQVATASRLFGWNYVGGVAERFASHGMCAYQDSGNPWVRGFYSSGNLPVFPFLESLYVQGDVSGTLHPTTEGASKIAENIALTINYSRTPTTLIRSGTGLSGFGAITITSDTNFRFQAYADPVVPESSGLGSTYYYLEPPGAVSGACSPQNQAGCLLASAQGFDIPITGSGSWEVGYFSCNKWNNDLKGWQFPEGHPREFESMEGVGCEAMQTATINMSVPTQLNLTYSDSGEPYQQGQWSSVPIHAAIEGGELPAFISGITSYYLLSNDLQDTSCNFNSYGSGSCTEFPELLSISQPGQNFLNYFSIRTPSTGPVEPIDPRELVAFVNIDTTPPAIGELSLLPLPNSFGWNNSDVSALWSCTDAESGPAEPFVSTVITQEGENQNIAVSCSNLAGLFSSSSETVSIDKTPPQASANPDRVPDSHGWYNRPFAISWTGSDALSGIPAGGCSMNNGYSGPDTAAGTIAGGCEDRAGNLSNSSSFQFQYDSSSPTVSPQPSRAPNAAGWYRQSFTVAWPGTDMLSGIAGCSADALINGPDTATGQVQGQCSDIAGNLSQIATYDFRFDATVPQLSPAPSRAPDSNGWYNHGFSVSWPGSDNLSGIAHCSEEQSFSGPDTDAGLLQGSCSDLADNDTGAVDFNFLYDATLPTVNYHGNSGSYRVTDTIDILCTVDDNLSGVATDSCVNISGPAYSFDVGNNQYAAVATDVAGNQGVGETSFNLIVEHDDLAALVCSFVSKQGICNSLSSKLANIKTAVERGRSNQAENQLRAFVNQLEAQRDKSISSEDVDTVRRLLNGL